MIELRAPETVKKPKKTDFAQAINLAWETGRLKYKLQPRQQEVYELIAASKAEDVFTILCSRGFGKTFTGCTLAIETALKNPGTNILIISSTLKKLRTIVKPAFQTILDDCPEDKKPRYFVQDAVYEFQNGSKVHLCAAERGRIEDLRGIHKVTLVLIDEAAFFGDDDDSYPLNYVVDNILTPMFMRTESKARIIMMSTPPEIPNHPFRDYVNQAKIRGSYAEFNIFQSDVPEEKIEEIRERYTNLDAWRRECMCEWVVDTNRTVVPEFKQDLHVQDVIRPVYYDLLPKTMGMDLGVRDFTAAAFGYYDFPTATIVIQGEMAIKEHEALTSNISKNIQEVEKELKWTGSKISRWCDNSNLILINDLNDVNSPNRVSMLATSKEDKAEMVNKVRILFQQNRIKISPKCKMLIATLESAVWDKKRQDFTRTVALGHMDMLDALIYLVRNIDMFSNPFPADYGYNKIDHVYPQNWDQRARTKEGQLLQKVFSGARFNKQTPPPKQVWGGL